MPCLWRSFRAGLLALIPIFVIVFVISIIWGVFLSVNFRFLDNCWLNILLNLTLYFTVIMVIGWLISHRWFRNLAIAVGSKIPIVSIFVNFFLNHDYVEKISRGDLPEVIFYHAGCVTLGTVTNEFKMPEFITYGPQADWVMVLAPPTTPISITAQLHILRKSDVVFTGRLIKDTALTVASFGLSFQIDPKKFYTVKPPQP